MQHIWLIPACVIFVVGLLVASAHEQWKVAAGCKTLASACFAALGIAGAHLATSSHTAQLVAGGLCMGFLADIVINLRYVFSSRKNELFAGGTLLFLIGHLIYILSVWAPSLQAIALVLLGIALSVPLMRWIFERIKVPSEFKILGSIYMAVVLSLCCLSAARALAQPSLAHALFFLGACLFLISDVIHTLNNFGPEQVFSRRIQNLTLYYVGQILIALSIQL